MKKIKYLLIVLFIGIVGLSMLPGFVRSGTRDMIYHSPEETPEAPIAIVFGAGLKRDGTPSDALKDRLTQAIALYELDKVEGILVSGDNRTEDYNEPDAMALYLEETGGIPNNDIFIDYAGRRTYDTCIRAKEIWGIEAATLVTQEFHLPRALFLCEHMGIESQGLSASLQPYINESWFDTREIFATYQAIIDVYLWKPTYIGGAQEINLSNYKKSSLPASDSID